MLSHALRASVRNTNIPVITDPNFNQVSLLLHGDGTNGAQNNTFIGANNPAQYYGSFNGSSQYLTVPSSSAFAYGTGEFTVELWFNASDTTWRVLYEQTNQFSIQWSSATNGAGRIGIYLGATGGYSVVNNSALSTATWYHLALVRQSGVLKLYINGVAQTATFSFTTDLIASSQPLIYIGNYYAGGYEWSGKLSNLRVVKGTAVYTANFTPPTGNLTAISGTQLLTLQNATIVDNSTNAFTITNNGTVAMTDQYPTVTRNGNTTQGTNTPFSQAAGYWSNFFDNITTISRFDFPASSAFSIGTGDFTVEFWIYYTYKTGYQYPFGIGSSSNQECHVRFPDGGFGEKIQCGMQTNATSDSWSCALTKADFNEKWMHVAFTRSSSVCRFFVNGQLQNINNGANPSTYPYTSFTNTTNITDTEFNLGATHGGTNPFPGYISNFRYIKGTALYTSSFTPSTTPLTAVTNTQVLACQSNYFKDNSSNNFALSAVGSISVQPFSPFAPTSAYSTSVNGGSMYFDGTGDYLSVPSSTSLNLTGDFTVECWAYLNAVNTNNMICGSDNGSTSDYFNLSAGSINLAVSANSGPNFPAWTASIKTGVWNHIAITRVSNVLYAYLNGVQLTLSSGSSSESRQWFQSSVAFLVGRYGYTPSPWDVNGYISNLRVVNGTAVYTTAFTPPTAPLTAITNTSLLLSGTNAGIYDNAIKNDLETVGSTQVSTSVVKYGTGSMKFNGTTDYLSVPTNQNLDLGSGNFTLECWFYSTSGSGYICEITAPTNGYAQVAFGVDTNQVFALIGNTTGNNWQLVLGPSGSYSYNTWNHLAIVRNGTTATLYLNGTSVTSGSVAGSSYYSGVEKSSIGGFISGLYLFTGYIDDLRITKGIARYTANFTPPTSAFPNQ